MSHNVCIYFSDTGGGHRAAADAIEAALQTLLAQSASPPDIHIIKDSIAEKSHPINRAFVEFYNLLLRHHQPLMKYYWSLLHVLKPEQSALNLKLTEKYFTRLLVKDQPSVVVSVHPMINHILANAIRILGLKNEVRLVVVVTDPNTELWRAWSCPDADLIVVPNMMVANQLEEFGFPGERICVLGMPVHPDFLKPPVVARREFLNHLGLSPDVLTVCLNAGWAGGGNMLRIYRALSQVERPLQTIFLCGHNTSLYEYAMAAAAESPLPTAVLPFHDCMSDLMSSVDLMVTKAGGLTTYQALARRLPLVFDVLTEPMPQERGTIDMLIRQRMAQSIHRADDIIDIIEAFEPNTNRQHQPLPEAYELDLTDGGVFEIAKKVLEFCVPPIVLQPKQAPEVTPCDLPQKSMVKQTQDGT